MMHEPWRGYVPVLSMGARLHPVRCPGTRPMRSVLSSNRAQTAERQVEEPLTSGMMWIPGGTFTMGSNRHYPEAAPAHRVTVDGFWTDPFSVTNARFRHFVEVTGHVYAGSLVFTNPPVRVDLGDSRQWWSFARGAQWRHPRDAASSLTGLDDHPVVHVTYSDAVAYATWLGKELPREAEWELVARGRLDGAEYAWGDTSACHVGFRCVSRGPSGEPPATA